MLFLCHQPTERQERDGGSQRCEPPRTPKRRAGSLCNPTRPRDGWPPPLGHPIHQSRQEEKGFGHHPQGVERLSPTPSRIRQPVAPLPCGAGGREGLGQDPTGSVGQPAGKRCGTSALSSGIGGRFPSSLAFSVAERKAPWPGTQGHLDAPLPTVSSSPRKLKDPFSFKQERAADFEQFTCFPPGLRSPWHSC